MMEETRKQIEAIDPRWQYYIGQDGRYIVYPETVMRLIATAILDEALKYPQPLNELTAQLHKIVDVGGAKPKSAILADLRALIAAAAEAASIAGEQRGYERCLREMQVISHQDNQMSPGVWVDRKLAALTQPSTEYMNGDQIKPDLPWPVDCDKCREILKKSPNFPLDGQYSQHYIFHVPATQPPASTGDIIEIIVKSWHLGDKYTCKACGKGRFSADTPICPSCGQEHRVQL